VSFISQLDHTSNSCSAECRSYPCYVRAMWVKWRMRIWINKTNIDQSFSRPCKTLQRSVIFQQAIGW